MKQCEACAKAKAKQKNIKKVQFDNIKKPIVPGTKIGIGISYISEKNMEVQVSGYSALIMGWIIAGVTSSRARMKWAQR